MEMILKPEIVDKIQNDPVLFGRVAELFGIKPMSLYQILAANKPRLTKASMLRLLREYWGVQDSDLLTEMPIPRPFNQKDQQIKEKTGCIIT